MSFVVLPTRKERIIDLSENKQNNVESTFCRLEYDMKRIEAKRRNHDGFTQVNKQKYSLNFILNI